MLYDTLLNADAILDVKPWCHKKKIQKTKKKIEIENIDFWIKYPVRSFSYGFLDNEERYKDKFRVQTILHLPMSTHYILIIFDVYLSFYYFHFLSYEHDVKFST